MQQDEVQPITQERVAQDLLWPLFRSLDENYKMRYARDIWEQFENGIRSASYTSKLSYFLEMITKKLPIQLQAQYSKEVMGIIGSGEDELILDWIRSETTILTLHVRLMNQDRKEVLNLKREPLKTKMPADHTPIPEQTSLGF